MGIWLRCCSRSATILNQYRRRRNWHFNASVPVSLLHGNNFPQQEEANVLPFSRSHSNAPFFFTRGYAVLAKVKKDEGSKVEVKHAADDPEGPRINSAITSDPVRLVTDKGHQVLSRREALDYAKKLKLDLVEVQRHAKPPVCKVMDYNKEKYKQQQREKERTKNKLDLTVRKGECREVRFTAKTEQKDLERKAEMAKRLMDRGYRVKCMAMGHEGQNLEELLLHLSTLIEDVSFVESGPKAEKKNAWMIVRHMKFGGTKKKGAQQTPKTVERTKGETVKDNLRRTVESESNKEDSVVSPKEQSKEELVQFEEFASFEQLGEHETEFIPFEESASFEQFGDNEVEFAPIEKSDCFEQSGEHETEVVPSTEKVEETFIANVHFTNKMEMPATKRAKHEEFMAVDIQNDIETQPETGDSNADISINKRMQDYQRMQNLAGTHHITQSLLASNTGMSPKQANFPVKTKGESASIVHSMDAPLGNFDSPTSEIVKQIKSLSNKLNIGQVKPEQFEISDVKQAVSVHSLRQAVMGRSQGHSASIDSAPKWASGSFKADVIDVPCDLPSNVSVACEEASNIGEQLQKSPVNLNNDNALQDQQEIPIASAHIFVDDQQEMPIASSHISGHVSRHDLVSRCFGDQGTNMSKTGKQSSVDSVSKAVHVSGGSHWGIFGQAKSPAVNVNNAAPTETEIGVAYGKHSDPSDYSRQVLAGAGSSPLGISASNKGKQKPLDLISKKANDSGVFTSDNPKEVSPFSVQVSNNARSRDSSRISISKSPVSGDGRPSEHSIQVLAGTGSIALGNSASSKGNQKPLGLIPKQVNDSGVSICGNSKEVPSSSVQEKSNSMSRETSRISDSKNPVPGDDKSQSPTDSSPSIQGNHGSVTGKQASSSGGSQWGIFGAPRSAVFESTSHHTGVREDQIKKVSAPRSAVVESPSHPAGVTADQTKDQPYSSEEQNISTSGKVGSSVEPRHLHLQNQRHVPSEYSIQVLSGGGSSAIGHSASGKGKQKPLDSTPKEVNDLRVSICGISKEAPSSSVQESNNSMSRDPSRFSGSKIPVRGDDKSQSPTDSSPSSQGNHASVTGKQASTSGSSRWGIFSAPKSASFESTSHRTGVTEDQTREVSAPRSAVVESPSHPAGVTADQTKGQPYSSEEQIISASGKVGSGVEPRHLHLQNQRHVPRGSVGTTKQVAKQALKEIPDSMKDQPYSSEGQNIGACSKERSTADRSHFHPQNQRHVRVGSVGIANQVTKQAPKETPTEVVDKPTQTRWGIFSMRAPSKPDDGQEKPGG